MKNRLKWGFIAISTLNFLSGFTFGDFKNALIVKSYLVIKNRYIKTDKNGDSLKTQLARAPHKAPSFYPKSLTKVLQVQIKISF